MKNLNKYIVEKFRITKKDYSADDIYYNVTLDIFKNYLDYTSFTITEIKKYIESNTSILCKGITEVYNWVQNNSVLNFKAYSSEAILDKSENTMRENFIVDDNMFNKYISELIIRKNDNYLVYDSKTQAGITIYIKDDVLIYQDYNKRLMYTYTYIFVKDE